MLDELQGLADALNWTMEDALREFGGAIKSIMAKVAALF